MENAVFKEKKTDDSWQLKYLCNFTLFIFIIFNTVTIPAQVKEGDSHSSKEILIDNKAYSDTNAQSSLLLDQLIISALENNPEIKVMQRNYDMMRARIPQAKSLPEPMLSFGYLGNITPLPPFDIQKGDPSSARILSFSQEIPFPGKRDLKGKMATVDADAEWWVYEQLHLSIIAEVKDNYFELCYLNKAIDTTTKIKSLLEKVSHIAEASYAVGKGLQQDLLKAQIEISKATEQLTLLEARRQVVIAKLNSLLYRDPDSPIGNPAELTPFEFSHTLAGLYEIAFSASPILKQQKRKIDREQYNIELAKKEFYPDMSVAFTYQNRPGMPEMYGINVSLKLPLYFWQKQRPALIEATAGAIAERKRLETAVSLLQFQIKEKYQAVTTADRLIRLYGDVIIIQSSLSLESTITAYEAGKVDFLSLLDSLITLRNYQLGYYEQLSNKEKAVAALESLVGSSLKQ